MASRRDLLHKIAIVISGLIMTLLAMTADARLSHSELDAAWKDYLGQRSNTPPAYRFPHATCFKSAALQYDLPESLLLAVARGGKRL